MPPPDPILYSFRRCPYAIRVRLCILEAGLRVELREVHLRDKPPAMLDVSPKGTVPILVLPDRTLDESMDIIRFVLPCDHPWRTSEAEDLELIARNDGPFKHHLDRAKYAARYPDDDPAMHWAAAEEILGDLDRRLLRGSLSQAHFGMADVSIGPFVRQLVNHDPQRFAALGLTRLAAWLESFVCHPRFLRAMEKVPVWSPEQAPFSFGCRP